MTVADNYRAYIRQSKCLHRIRVSSFTRIRSATDLEAAAKTSVTCMRTLADVRKVLNLTGANNDAGGLDETTGPPKSSAASARTATVRRRTGFAAMTTADR